MEDPESEWKIQEYSYSKEDDETANMMKSMLTIGYGIGRKIVITGIVISSAPLVVPPLIVFSAMGVAVSLPFGLLFASYACTNKLMSMLLPTPPRPPLMLEYFADECQPENDERVDCKLELHDDYTQLDVVEDDYGPQVEGNEQMEDINQGVETKIVFQLDDDYRQEGQSLITDVGENVGHEEKERGQMEDIKQAVEMRPSFDLAADDQGYLEGDDDSLEEDRKGAGQLIETRIDENTSNTHQLNEDAKLRVDNAVEDVCIVSQSASNVAFGDFKDVETAKPVTFNKMQSEDNEQGVETEMALELDEGQTLVTNVDKDVVEDDTLQRENVTEEKQREQMEDVKQGVEMRTGFDIAGDDQGYEEDDAEHLEGGDDGLEEQRRGKEPLVNENKSHREDEKLREEGRVHNRVGDDYVVGESVSNAVFRDVKDVETTKPVQVKEVDSQKLVGGGKMRHVVILSYGNEENNFNPRRVEELDLVAREVIGDANKDKRDIKSDEKVVIGTQEKTGREEVIMEEHLVRSNADSWENGCLDLLGERNTNNNLESLEIGNEVKENVAAENVDVKVAHKKMPSQEGNLDDEKIWEKISAMRTIVGYKAPSQPTCIGELKALYLFTGVEPPASFEGDSDLDEVTARLKFLMAIVGVK